MPSIQAPSLLIITFINLSPTGVLIEYDDDAWFLVLNIMRMTLNEDYDIYELEICDACRWLFMGVTDGGRSMSRRNRQQT